jgi:hypothetical protein
MKNILPRGKKNFVEPLMEDLADGTKRQMELSSTLPIHVTR